MHALLCDAILGVTGFFAAIVFAQISPDAAATFGGIVAGIIALEDARQTQKSIFHLSCVVISSIASGMLVPGAILFNMYPDSAGRLTFHIWALLGIGFGLLGWGFVRLVFALRDYILRRKDKLAELAAGRLGVPPEQK